MRLLLQRVTSASVNIEGATVAQIEAGLLLFLGIAPEDSLDDVVWLVRKVVALRVFDDAQGVMNLSLLDTQGQALVVSQFTLMGSYKKGNRPSYIRAAPPQQAISLYEAFVQQLSEALGPPSAYRTIWCRHAGEPRQRWSRNPLHGHPQ